MSFSAKTYVKEISPINASSGQDSVFMSWRSGRRGDRDQQGHQTGTPVMPPPPPPPQQQAKEVAVPSETAASKPESKAEQPTLHSSSTVASPRVAPTEVPVTCGPQVENVSIYPSLITCARPIGEILPQIAPGVQL